MVACPTCGAAMEAGFLGAQNWPAGIQWFRWRSFFGVRGEPVGENDERRCRGSHRTVARVAA